MHPTSSKMKTIDGDTHGVKSYDKIPSPVLYKCRSVLKRAKRNKVHRKITNITCHMAIFAFPQKCFGRSLFDRIVSVQFKHSILII